MYWSVMIRRIHGIHRACLK